MKARYEAGELQPVSLDLTVLEFLQVFSALCVAKDDPRMDIAPMATDSSLMEHMAERLRDFGLTNKIPVLTRKSVFGQRAHDEALEKFKVFVTQRRLEDTIQQLLAGPVFSQPSGCKDCGDN